MSGWPQRTLSRQWGQLDVGENRRHLGRLPAGEAGVHRASPASTYACGSTADHKQGEVREVQARSPQSRQNSLPSMSSIVRHDSFSSSAS